MCFNCGHDKYRLAFASITTGIPERYKPVPTNYFQQYNAAERPF